jgi:hypothetical protein
LNAFTAALSRVFGLGGLSKISSTLGGIFMRQLSANSSLEDGSTLLLGGVSVTSQDGGVTEATTELKLLSPTSKKDFKKTLLVFITPQLIYTDGTPVHPQVK